MHQWRLRPPAWDWEVYTHMQSHHEPLPLWARGWGRRGEESKTMQLWIQAADGHVNSCPSSAPEHKKKAQRSELSIWRLWPEEAWAVLILPLAALRHVTVCFTPSGSSSSSSSLHWDCYCSHYRLQVCGLPWQHPTLYPALECYEVFLLMEQK